MKIRLLIPAAGLGTRLGSSTPKALLDLAGKPLLVRTLERFRSQGLLRGAIAVVPPDHLRHFVDVLGAAFPDEEVEAITGGSERQESVSLGLERLEGDTEIVVIHDAARPFVSEETIADSISAARETGAATAAVPSVDTVLEVSQEGFLSSTPDRGGLWMCQTPQTFRVNIIREAHAAAREAGRRETDDATLVLRNGGAVKIVMGSPENLKITTASDLAHAEYLVREKQLAGT